MLKFGSFLLCFFVGYGAPAYVDTLSKCAIQDFDCMKNLYENIIRSFSNGAPDLGIPPLDPMKLNNVTFSFSGLLDVILNDATVTGISGCVFDAFTLDLKKGFGYQENTCSIAIEGQYKIVSNAIINTFLGEHAIHGDGYLKVAIDNMHLTFDFPAHAEKRDDGEIYMKVDYKNIKYGYELRGDGKIAADNIYLGEQESSKTIIPLINQNWKFLLSTFGKPVIDKAAEIYFDNAAKFFEKVPTKHYISDDLTPFVKP